MAELTAFLQNGATYHFTEVENVKIVEEFYLEFDYYGQSTMKKRHASFDLGNVAGYALDNEKVEDDSTEEKEDVKVPLKYREHIDVNQAIDDVLNFDTENGDKETAKIINDRLYTAIIQDYMEKNGSEIDEDKLGDHFMKLMWKKVVKDANVEKAKEKDFDF